MNLFGKRTEILPLPSATRLLIESAGLCCALGYNLDAISCALRANIDHFQESQFSTRSGESVRVAALPDAIYGQARLQLWVEHALNDCVRSMSETSMLFDAKRTPIVILSPDSSRVYSDSNVYVDTILNALATLIPGDSVPAYRSVTVVPHGRAGLTEGLKQASAFMVLPGVERVLLISVDSLLNAADINLLLRTVRLLTPGNTDGFLPGEACAVLVLRAAKPETSGTLIQGFGEAYEPGRPDGSVPSRAMGLSQAMRSACAQAELSPTALMFRLSDQNGEQFFSREAANAATRVMVGARQTHLTLADKLGEVGAATGPAMLAWLWHDMPRADCGPDSPGLVHLANDDGRRCAAVIHYKGERHYGNPRLR